jgi:hypothetical protein
MTNKTLKLKVQWGIFDKVSKKAELFEKDSRVVFSHDRRLVFLVYTDGTTSAPVYNYVVLPNGRTVSLGNNDKDLKEITVEIIDGFFDPKTKKVGKISEIGKKVEVFKNSKGRENVYIDGVQANIFLTKLIELPTRDGGKQLFNFEKKNS